MFYVINMLEYFKKVFIFLIDHDQKVIPIFDSIMNPSAGYMEDIGYINYVSDFVEAATSELFNSHEEVSSHLKGKFTKNDNRVFAPTRLNVYYTSRLIYKENWFSGVISRLLKEVELDDQASIILRDLMAISENEWIDIGNPQSSRSLLVSADTLSYLNLTIPKPGQQKYIYKMSLSDQQRKIIESYNNQYMTDDDSYISNILDFIHPRKLLRYACIEVESVPNHE